MTAKEEKALKFLRNISPHLYRFDYNDVKPWLIDHLGRVPIPHFKDNKLRRFKEGKYYRDPTELYRAVENFTYSPKSTIKFPYKEIERVSHVPLNKQHIVKDYGRCNLPSEAKFYCSNFYPTACLECLTNGFVKDITESKTVTMSTWKIKEPLVLAEVMFSKDKLNNLKGFDPGRYEEQIKYADDWYNNMLITFQKDTESSYSNDYSIEVLKIFSDEFGKINIESGRDYILSNYYCESIFNHTFLGESKIQIDGIIYPSVKFNYKEYNVVIHPRAMNKLSFAYATQVLVHYDSNKKGISYQPLETGYNDGQGGIKWNIFNY